MLKSLSTAVIATAISLSTALHAQDINTENWSSHAGNGQYAPPNDGTPLVDNASEIKVLWQHKQHVGIGKSGLAHPLKLSEAGIPPFYGGCANLIVADGIVFVTFFTPTGEALNKKARNRYFKDPESQPKSLRQIDGNDVTMALDAETGKELWRVSEDGNGMNFMSAKRGHYGVTPAYDKGVVYSFGALGRVYAYDAKTGEKKWESNNGKWHERAEAVKKALIADERIADLYSGDRKQIGMFQYRQTGMMVLDEVLIVPDLNGGLMGINTADGKQVWHVPGIQTTRATPGVWVKDGKPYLMCTKVNGGLGATITLLAAKEGKVIWNFKKGLGPNHSALVVGQDHVILNTRGNLNMGQRGPRGDVKLGSGLNACYEISLDGLVQKWILPDEEMYWHAVRPDRGHGRFLGAIRNDKVILLHGGAGKQHPRFISTFDLKTGKKISSLQHSMGCATSPILVNNRIFVQRDTAHSGNGAGLKVYGINDKGELSDLGLCEYDKGLKTLIITGYLTPTETPYYKGRLYAKGWRGVVAFDLKK